MAAKDRIVDTAMTDSADGMAQFGSSVAPRAAGAVVVFSGVVRDHDDGRGVTQLEYEAHPSAAEVLASVAHEVLDRHPSVSAVRMAHRTGLLQIGDCALLAQVSAPHRADAFEACAELVEKVKAVLPVWKRQVFDDGSEEWVNSP